MESAAAQVLLAWPHMDFMLWRSAACQSEKDAGACFPGLIRNCSRHSSWAGMLCKQMLLKKRNKNKALVHDLVGKAEKSSGRYLALLPHNQTKPSSISTNLEWVTGPCNEHTQAKHNWGSGFSSYKCVWSIGIGMALPQMWSPLT